MTVMTEEYWEEFERDLKDRLYQEMSSITLPQDFWPRLSQRLGQEQKSALRIRWLVGAIALAVTVFGALALILVPRPPTVSAQEILERLDEASGPLSVGVTTYHMILQTNDGLRQEIWFQAPDQYRIETTLYIGVADGLKFIEFRPEEESATIYGFDRAILPNQPPTSGLAETLATRTYYEATLVGIEKVAGRPAYLLELRPTFARAVNSSQPQVIEGLVKWWLDTETLFELRYEQYTTDGRLVDSREVVSIQYNISLPEDFFLLEIPPWVSVVDMRPGQRPTTPEELAEANLGFTVFMPVYIPEILSSEPEITTIGPIPQAELFYSSPTDPTTWLKVVETASRNAPAEILGEPIDINGIEGRLTVGDGVDYPNMVVLIREGTYIALWSLTLSPEELVAIASSLQPVD